MRRARSSAESIGCPRTDRSSMKIALPVFHISNQQIVDKSEIRSVIAAASRRLMRAPHS
jgi:hypothetical protein